MIKKKTVNIFVMIILLAAVSYIVVFSIFNEFMNRNKEAHIFEELTGSSSDQVKYINQILEFQYVPLELMSDYIGNRGDFSLEIYADVIKAFMDANEITVMHYVDLNGVCYNEIGEKTADVCNKSYYKAIVSGEKKNVIEYVSPLENGDEPRAVFAVPIYKNDDINGVLIAEKRLHFLDKALLSEAFDGNDCIFITDCDGNFIAVNSKSKKLFSHPNFFGSYTDNEIADAKKTMIKQHLANGESGQLKINGENTMFLAYTPLNIDDWMLFSMIDEEAAFEKYDIHQQNMRTAVMRTTAVFLLVIAYVVGVNMHHNAKIKKESERLRLQVERNQKITDELKVSVYDYNLLTGEFKINDNFKSIFGFDLPSKISLEEMRKKETKFNVSEFLSKIEHMRKTKETVYFEAPTPLGDCKYKWMRIMVTPFFNDAGELVSTYGVVSDITEIRENTDKALEHLPGGVHKCQLSEPMHLEYANEGVAKLLGYTKQEFDSYVGDVYVRVIYEEDIPVFADFVNNLSKAPSVATCKYRMVCKDGSLIHVTDTMESVLDDNGIMHGYSTIIDITDIVKQNEQLQETAKLDAHTELPNKNACEELITDELLDEPTCFVMLDLNNLKLVNDTKGHAVGDRMIKSFADIVRSAVPKEHFVGRFGGDEFIIIAKNVDNVLVKSWLIEMRDKAAEFNKNESEYSLRCAYGYSFADVNDKLTMKQLLEKADSDMYECKRAQKKARAEKMRVQ